jgi:tetratricopeptide (TPR) repeat protein
MIYKPAIILLLAFLAMVASTCLIGCQAIQSGPYTPQSEAARDPLEAQRLTMLAADILADCGTEREDLNKAEALLRQALTADLYHGPAHNNLGVVYLKQSRLYDAAGEFTWGSKLMPSAAGPRVNLALTLERAGRTKEALEGYRTALEVYPEYIEAMQGLARLQIRRSKTDDDTQLYLKEIALRGTSPAWREWAQRRLSHAEN